MRSFDQSTPVYLRASFGQRALAAFLDLIILATLSSPVTMVTSAADLIFRKLNADNLPTHYDAFVLVLNLISGLALTFFYVGYFYKHRGATLGKSILNLKVVCLPYGETPSYKVGFLRDIFGKFLSVFTFFVGYLMVLFRKDRRALHDLISDTVVIKRV